MLGLDLPTLISRVIILVIAFTVHEFAHAFVANAFGDDTPRMNGRLSLNPIVHLDPMGSLLLIVGGFGWARPVPVNPYALGRRSSAALMWVSLAGPMSNFLLAAAMAIPLRLNLIPFQFNPDSALPSFYEFSLEFIWINLALMLFNLLPIAPLDGDKIAAYFLPPSLGRVLDIIRPYGPIILLLIIFIPPRLGFPIMSWIMGPAMNNLIQLLVGG